MQIILAKTAGFCFGVDRAVEMVNESVRRGNKTATLGPIIHNRHVVERFLKQGVREIRFAGARQSPARRSLSARTACRSRCSRRFARAAFRCVDATCPFVKKIHTIVQNETQKGRKIHYLSARPTHPEVEAIASFCREPLIVQSRRGAGKLASRGTRAAESSHQHGEPDDQLTENVEKLRRNRKKSVYKLRNI